MRILTISDVVEPVLYGPYIRERVGRPDLILACGDLPYYYLEYIVSLLDVPLYYVHGNHDVPVNKATTEVHGKHATPFDWAFNLHGRMVNHDGLLLAGLEGSRVYNPGAPFQYSEGEAARQAFWLGWTLRRNRMRYGRYLDILVTHAPPYSIHDARDVAHTGFYTYLDMLRRYRPLLMIHGHNHVYNRSSAVAVDTRYVDTLVINTCGYRILEIEKRPQGGWELITSNA